MKYRIFALIASFIILLAGCGKEEKIPEFDFAPFEITKNENTIYFNSDIKDFSKRLSDINKEVYNDSSIDFESWVDMGQTLYTETDIPYQTYIYRVDQRAYLHPAISVMCSENGILKVTVVFHEESLTSYTEDTYKRFITLCASAFYPDIEWEKLSRHIDELYNEPYFEELSALEQKYYKNNGIVSTAVARDGTRTTEFFPYDPGIKVNYYKI